MSKEEIMYSDSRIDAYVKSIQNYPRIDRDREKYLSSIIQNSKNTSEINEAKDELVTANLFMVVKCAMDVMKKYHGSLSLIELISEGNIGLIRAANAYQGDHKSNASFGSYAFQSITRQMEKGVRDQYVVKVPSHFNRYCYQVECLDKEGLSDEEIVKKLDISIETLRVLRKGISNLFLEDMNREDGLCWEDFFKDDINSGSEKPVSDHMITEFIDKKLSILNEREKNIIYDIYYSRQEPTYGQLAIKYGISPERIRQIHFKSLRKIKNSIMKSFQPKGKKHSRLIRGYHYDFNFSNMNVVERTKNSYNIERQNSSKIFNKIIGVEDFNKNEMNYINDNGKTDTAAQLK